jgi:hypothetical protein
VAVCEGVVKTRIQPTESQIFSSECSRCCGPPSKVKRLENCAAQDRSKSSPGIPDTLSLPAAGGCGEKSAMQCFSVARAQYAGTAGRFRSAGIKNETQWAMGRDVCPGVQTTRSSTVGVCAPGVITPSVGVIIPPVWCDHYSCFSLTFLRTTIHLHTHSKAQVSACTHHASSDEPSPECLENKQQTHTSG